LKKNVKVGMSNYTKGYNFKLILIIIKVFIVYQQSKYYILFHIININNWNPIKLTLNYFNKYIVLKYVCAIIILLKFNQTTSTVLK
jgi:hypothetical protein